MRPADRSGGYTLLEILVVLILMGLAAALVVPAVVPPKQGIDASDLSRLVSDARETAIRRGESMYVSLGGDGSWRVDGASSGDQGPLASGRLGDYSGPNATLIISPTGSCGFDTRSGEAARAIDIDPLTCELRQQ